MDLNNKFGWQDIDGWFGYAHIYDQIIREASKNDTIIEISRWLGKSTCYLASRAKMSGKSVKIVCVDAFENTSNQTSCSLAKNILSNFNENMTKAGVIDCIYTMVMTNEIASYNIGNEAIFAVFIDGGEIKDIKNWYPKIKPGGIIAGYSISMHESINKTIELLGCKEFKEEDGIWFARKPNSGRLN